jgi:hypothetical protein
LLNQVSGGEQPYEYPFRSAQPNHLIFELTGYTSLPEGIAGFKPDAKSPLQQTGLWMTRKGRLPDVDSASMPRALGREPQKDFFNTIGTYNTIGT